VRILELSQRYPPAVGGVEATLEELVARLRSTGIDVEVFTTDLVSSRPFVRARIPSLVPDGFPRRFRSMRVAPLPLGLGIIAPGMLVAAAFERTDVLHAHAFGYFPTWVGAAIRRWRSIPLVITPHSDPGRGLPFSQLYHETVARATLRHADRVVVQSEVEARFLRGLAVPEHRLVRIPTGISLDDLSPMPRTASGTPVRFLTVGRLDTEQKGLTTLVRAAAALPPSVPIAVQFIGEDWGGLGEIRALAARLGVAERISVRTSVPRSSLLEAYREADVFVLPSRFESFPRALLEAMAAALPVVATRVGGVPEMVAEGQNALLVPPDDPAGLAAALRTLAQDERMRDRFGRESRRLAGAYDWSNILPRYLALFEELHSGGRTRSWLPGE
jgi:glycogen synthase